MNPNTAKKLTRKAAIVGGKTLLSYFDRHKYKGHFKGEISNKMILTAEAKMAAVFEDSLSSIAYEQGTGELRLGKHKIKCFACDAPFQHWQGIRRFAVAVAWYHNKEVVRGGIFLPVDNELYYSEQDKISKRNNTMIQMIEPVELKDAYLAIIHGGHQAGEVEFNIARNLKSSGIRWTMSDGLLYSAALLLNNNLNAIILTDLDSPYLPLLEMMMLSNDGCVVRLSPQDGHSKEVVVLCHKRFSRLIVEQLTGVFALE